MLHLLAGGPPCLGRGDGQCTQHADSAAGVSILTDQSLSVAGIRCYICRQHGHLAPVEVVDNGPKTLTQQLLVTSTIPLQLIRCYICGQHGHLACVEVVDNGPKTVTCYQCGQAGHSGDGCARGRGAFERDDGGPTCYRCGEKGHIARGCSKQVRVLVRLKAHKAA
jgi:hypothetical protein